MADNQAPDGAAAANQADAIPQWGQLLQQQAHDQGQMMVQMFAMLQNLQPAPPAQNAQADGQQPQDGLAAGPNQQAPEGQPISPPPAQPPPPGIVNVPPPQLVPQLVPPPPAVGGLAVAPAPVAAPGAAGPAVVDDLNPTAQAIFEALQARQAILRDNPDARPADFKAALFCYTSLEPPPIYDMNEGARATGKTCGATTSKELQKELIQMKSPTSFEVSFVKPSPRRPTTG